MWTRKIGIPDDRVVRHPDNFWAMGDTGPCGPNTEIFYDLGLGVPGGPPGSPDEGGDRYTEIWNLVFPDRTRFADGTSEPLPAPGVDTGMGLERIATVAQGWVNNYDNDLLRPLTEAAAGLAGHVPHSVLSDNPSLCVLADHARAAVFLAAEGIRPGNEGREYVLRRIIRRGMLHARKLGVAGPVFPRMVGPVFKAMEFAYSRWLGGWEKEIAETLEAEENRFRNTLKAGMRMLHSWLTPIPEGGALPPEVAFKLHDTHGFPLDLTVEEARSCGVSRGCRGLRQAAGGAARAGAGGSKEQEPLRFGLSRLGSVRHGVARQGLARPGTFWRGKARQGTARSGEAGHGEAGQGQAGLGPARPGLARQGVARFGKAWTKGAERPLCFFRIAEKNNRPARGGPAGVSRSP